MECFFFFCINDLLIYLLINKKFIKHIKKNFFLCYMNENLNNKNDLDYYFYYLL